MNFASLPKEMPDSCYDILDGMYKVFYTIGEGQFAKYFINFLIFIRVKLCSNLDNTEWFAVKIMREEHINTPEKIEKFMNEIRILSQCNNSHIIQILRVSLSGVLKKADGTKKLAVYYVMKYAFFGEIFSLVQEKGRLPENLVRTFILQLLDGLQYLHSNRIFHRDLKPENLLLDQSLKIVIADFGSAIINKTSDLDKKQFLFDNNIPIGSKEYNAPEITIGKYYYAEFSDMFSIGVILFVLTFGKMPFGIASPGDPYFELLSKKDKSTYWSIFGPPNIVSAEFKDLFENLTQLDPEKRLNLSDTRNHPWFKGKIYSAAELAEILKDQKEYYNQLSRRRMHEFQAKLKCKKRAMKQKSLSHSILYDKLSHDIRLVSFHSECIAINDYLSQKPEELKEPQPQSDDNASDDQVILSPDSSPNEEKTFQSR